MNEPLTVAHAQALTSVALLAALADGVKTEPERERVRQMVEALGEPGHDVGQAVQRVLLGQTTLAEQVARLDTPQVRHLAWEAALGVCESDGATTPAERAFLTDLAAKLGRPGAEAQAEVDLLDRAAASPAGAMPALPVLLPPALPGAMPGALAGTSAPSALAAAPAPVIDAKAVEVDKSVLRYAILTAGLDLLPQGLASVAIIPLQTKMVHGIGATYGYPLSASSIKEFIAAIGIGSAGQMVESYARKFLGKLAGKYLGSVAKTAVNWGTGPVLTFATTYAMGMVAKQYYAGGRTLSAINLQTLFSAQFEQAKGLYAQYEPQVQAAASKADPRQLLTMLRG